MKAEERGKLIGEIISVLRFKAQESEPKKIFDEADTFISLCFAEDKDLLNIARLCNV